MNRVKEYLDRLTKEELIEFLKEIGVSHSELDTARASSKENIIGHILNNHYDIASEKCADKLDNTLGGLGI